MKGAAFYAVVALLFISCGKDDSNPQEQIESGETVTAVDLGLSVKWANVNIGAGSPDSYGFYFAWGETMAKVEYSWYTYFYCEGEESHKLNKYNTRESYGTVDNRTVLERGDDAAYINWGGKWRMPTKEEWDELCDNCEWIYTKENNTSGFRVTAKNGNSIFLPSAGHRYEGFRHFDALDYWSSSLNVEYPNMAYRLRGRTITNSDYRYNGLPIRPVKSK